MCHKFRIQRQRFTRRPKMCFFLLFILFYYSFSRLIKQMFKKMRRHRPPNHEKLALKWTYDCRKNRGKKVCLPVLRLSPQSLPLEFLFRWWQRKMLIFRPLDRFCNYYFQSKQISSCIKPKFNTRMLTMPPKTQYGCAGTARPLLLMQ